MSKRSIVIYGPQACGKSRHAQRLREHFGLQDVVDDWDGHTVYPPEDTLVLTCNPDAVAEGTSRVMDFGTAMAELVASAQA
ncbi:TPA: hypothetical protein R4K21_003632 [Stenotrophomonas maltophilia]|nr:hypothetical protein [Stenotrophomonas maltophilia]